MNFRGLYTFDMDTHKYIEVGSLEKIWESKEYWYIDIDGEINSGDMEDDTVKDMRKIGNYFETKEEAERAVEKLKAWKRLKQNLIDHVLKYEFDEMTEDIHANLSFTVGSYPTVGNDLDLIFGGKE